MYLCTFARTHTHARTHACTHARTRTHTHTHTRTHTHTHCTNRDDSLAVRITVPGLLVDLQRAFGCEHTDQPWHLAAGRGEERVISDPVLLTCSLVVPEAPLQPEQK